MGLGLIPEPATYHLVGQGSHVAATLHVVLPSQRVQTRAVLADVAGQKPEVDEREHTICAVVVLGDAQGPVEGGPLRRRVHPGYFADVVRGNASDLLGVLRGVAGYLLPVLLEVLRGPLDELLVDRKSTRLNSSHANISYAVFCLKKK